MKEVGLVAAVLAAAAIAGSGASATQPEPPRTITRNTTWTNEMSPVRTGSIHVLASVTLAIEPGVEVVVEPGAVLLFDGDLHAVGTASEPIVFTSESTWRGIVSRDVVRYTGSRIGHARIENAEVGVAMGRRAFPVNDTVFAHNDVGLRVDNPATDMAYTGNQFYSNGTGFSGKTTRVVALRRNDFWDNDVTLLFRAQGPYSCATDHGVFDVHDNDILRGPDAPWFSFDVRTSAQSGHTDMRVLASDNWWGTTDESSILARLRRQGQCCPSPVRAPVDWTDPAAAPQTPAEPPGPVGDPEEEPDFHGDPLYVADLRHPGWGECPERGAVQRIRGVVHEFLGPAPDEIPVALVRGTRRCKSYDPRRGFVRRACDDPIRVPVEVDREERFALELRRPLRPGRYTVYPGEIGAEFSKFRVVRG